jgi:putative membrane protein
MFPVGFIIMFTELGRAYLWTTTIFLGLQALIIFIILLYSADIISAIITTAVVIISSYFIEWWGVNSGLPFGAYSYTNVLLPIINGVPLAITFAWYVVAASSLLAARYMLRGCYSDSCIIGFHTCIRYSA